MLALENVRGVSIDQKTVSNNSLMVYSKSKTELSGKILKYSVLREWIESNNYWVEIGALVSEKDDEVNLLITINSSDTILEGYAVNVFQKEGFNILKEPRDFFPRITLNSTITEEKSYEFYGHKAFYTKVLVTAELKNVDNSTYELSELGDSSDLFPSRSLANALSEAIANLANRIKDILDAPRRLYLRIKNVDKNVDELQEILDFFNNPSSTIKIECFGSKEDLLYIIDISEEPLIFLSRIVKSFKRKINLAWKNGVYEIDIDSVN